MIVTTTSPAATKALAGQVADRLVEGDLLLLCGDLGAGKTAFTQGLAWALGIEEPVTSPTFTIMRHYDGRLRLHHLDVYRIESAAEAHDLGLSEILDDGAVVVVEWGDQIRAALPAEHLEIRFTLGEGDDDRELTFVAGGPRWATRLKSWDLV